MRVHALTGRGVPVDDREDLRRCADQALLRGDAEALGEQVAVGDGAVVLVRELAESFGEADQERALTGGEFRVFEGDDVCDRVIRDGGEPSPARGRPRGGRRCPPATAASPA